MKSVFVNPQATTRPCGTANRLRCTRCWAATATKQAAPPQRNIPKLKGSVPWLGALAKYSLPELHEVLQDAMVKGGSPVMEVEILGVKNVYCRQPEDCATILKDQGRFPKSLSRLSAWLGDGLISNTDLENHAAVRSILMPAFKTAYIRGFVPAFARSAAELAEALAAASGKTVDVEPLCRSATFDVIGRTGFGYEFNALKTAATKMKTGSKDVSKELGEDHIDIIEIHDGILAGAMWLVFDLPVPDSLLPEIKPYRRGVAAVDSIINKMVAERRANGIPPEATDLLSFMLLAQEGGSEIMTDKQLRDELQTMMLAGSDSIATTLTFALGELARHPEVATAAAAEVAAAIGDADPASVPAEVYQSGLPLVTAIANETMRVYPVLTNPSRICANDEVLGGYHIPAGTTVLPAIYSLHRHEDFWPRPNEWIPDRWLPANAPTMAPHADKAFMPFTVGPRACIGRYFAQLELQVLIAVLLQRFTFESAPGRTMGTRMNLTLTSRDGVHLIPHVKH